MMGEIVAIARYHEAHKVRTKAERTGAEDAQLLFFTGVRRERITAPAMDDEDSCNATGQPGQSKRFSQ